MRLAAVVISKHDYCEGYADVMFFGQQAIEIIRQHLGLSKRFQFDVLGED